HERLGEETRQGTVVGQIQGPEDQVKEMKFWLKNVGSPSSRIDRAVFSNERDIPKWSCKAFVPATEHANPC
uniref:Acylphosphatase-like domain-containing protein n=1 Tax=Salarias fasciatus TaxID=181472 RepID=A0A672G0D3_SALFA